MDCARTRCFYFTIHVIGNYIHRNDRLDSRNFNYFDYGIAWLPARAPYRFFLYLGHSCEVICAASLNKEAQWGYNRFNIIDPWSVLDTCRQVYISIVLPFTIFFTFYNFGELLSSGEPLLAAALFLPAPRLLWRCHATVRGDDAAR